MSGKSSITNWAIGGRSDDLKLKPNQKYHLQGWIYIQNMKPEDTAIVLGVTFYDEKTLISGYTTPPVDFMLREKWQLVEGDFITPEATAKSFFEIGKKPNNNLEFLIYFDDLNISEVN